MRGGRVAGVVVAIAALAAAAGAGAGGGDGQGPFRLASLPSLGDVTWRCGPDGRTFALGYRPARITATTTLLLVAGGRPVRRATVDDEAFAGPFLPARRQRLVLTQPTGAGTLRATVVVDFAASPAAPPCRRYLPPATRIAFGPRR